jgi:lysophospholipase L1-like esterase
VLSGLRRIATWIRGWCKPASQSVRHWPTPQGAVLHLLVFVAAALGVWALWNDLAPRWRTVMWVVVATVIAIRVIPLGRWLGCPGKVIEVTGALGALVIVPIFALLAIDAGLAPLVDRVSPRAGLIFGGIIIFIAGRIVLQPIWTGHELSRRWRLAAVNAVLLTIGPQIGIAIWGQLNGDGKTLDQRPLVTQLDVVVLRSDTVSAGEARATTRLRGWRISTWTGQVKGNQIIWAGGEPPQLNGHVDADRVLLLLPPATDNNAQARWMALADRAEPRATPTYALLQNPDKTQLEAWRQPLTGVTGRAGNALPLADVGGLTATEPELGVRVATESPTAAADLALAIAHRPILRFDTDEPVPRPLDVDELFKTGDIAMCEGGQKIRSRCVPIHGGDELQTGFNHLAFDSDTIATADVASRIYVHVTRVFPPYAGLNTAVHPNDNGLIYLDYWWYLPHNPAHSGSGAFCGPGFYIGGVTCFDHQSDWEGVTVILDADDPAGPPVAVNYAEHDGSVRYSWAALQRLWNQTRVQSLAPQDELAIRPLAFSARGTHASYPVACDKRSCPRNAVPGIRNTSALQDSPHDGKVRWSGNTDNACAATCVVALPTRLGGAEPEGWNAWSGEWGTANCVMGIFCSSAEPPRSPGRQERYEHPWCTDGVFDVAGSAYSGPDPVPPCVELTVSAGQITPTRRLLALGDSYSSGEGAGNYEPGTDTADNSCHRSRNAWPTLVAEQRNLQPVPSLACSGARLADVLAGRPTGEAERRLSQVGRIRGDPDLITITIGGNDLGFRKVLQHCILSDCVADYHRPSGDVLNAEIDRLARHLPDAYRTVQAAAPGARVVVVDYPKLFPDSDPRNPTPNCAAGRLITPAEGNYLNREVERADVAILDAARKAGVSGIDVSTAFNGGELTCSGKQFLNHANLRRKLFSGSFHPNADGQERLARAVSNALAVLNG